MLKRFFLFVFPLIIIFVFLKFMVLNLPSQRKHDNKKKNVSSKTENIIVNNKISPIEKTNNVNISSPSIIIDPGHGGDDTGFIGINKIHESDINLKFAFILARALRMKGLSVYLTRTGDYNLDKDSRLEMVIEHNTNLIVSIHCDYDESSDIKGMRILNSSEDDIPSLNIFLGYISNDIDYRNLNDKLFMEKTALGIADSIEKGLYKKSDG